MSPAYQVQLILAQEIAYDLLPEHKTHPSLRLPPHLHRTLRVRPQQVAQQPSVRNVGWPDDAVDLVDGSELGTEPTVHAKNAVFNQSGNRHAVEAVDEGLPKLDVVSTFACLTTKVHSS